MATATFKLLLFVLVNFRLFSTHSLPQTHYDDEYTAAKSPTTFTTYFDRVCCTVFQVNCQSFDKASLTEFTIQDFPNPEFSITTKATLVLTVNFCVYVVMLNQILAQIIQKPVWSALELLQ